IGRVKIILRGHTPGDIEIDHSWLNHHARIWKVYFKNPVHPRQADDNPVFDRQRPAAQACPRPSRDKPHPFAMADSNDRLNLFCSIWQHHRARHHAEICETVALVSMQFFRRRNQATVTYNSSQFVESMTHLCVLRKNSTALPRKEVAFLFRFAPRTAAHRSGEIAGRSALGYEKLGDGRDAALQEYEATNGGARPVPLMEDGRRMVSLL